MYLALITDLYSRKIVGYDISDSLEAEGCRRALKRALSIVRDTEKVLYITPIVESSTAARNILSF